MSRARIFDQTHGFRDHSLQHILQVEVQDQVWYRPVDPKPAYDISRPNLPSGTTVTFFAPFLGTERGCVFFLYEGVSCKCEIVDWQCESVTAVMPKLGLDGPKNVTIRIVQPDGVIKKEIPVLYVPQPTIIVHSNTIPQPLPPAGTSAPTTYAAPVQHGAVSVHQPVQQ